MTTENISSHETGSSGGECADTATARVWGESADREAAKQLGLDDTHTIVMMSTEIDYLDDVVELVIVIAALLHLANETHGSVTVPHVCHASYPAPQ